MFDDPMKELDRLNAELLAEEADWEEDWEAEFLEQEDDLADIKALLDDGRHSHFAGAYSRQMTRQLMEDYDEADARDSWHGDDEDRAIYRDSPPETKKKQKKEKGIRGLLALAVLELMGILGILIYWVVWLW